MKFIYLVFGIAFYFAFAYDIENDKDFFTWLWLLNSILCFLLLTISFIIDKKE